MSAQVILRAYQSTDLDAVLHMNHDSVHFLAPMDAARLALMQSWSARFRVLEFDGATAGFLVTFEDGSAYDSVNYRWFSSHLKRFVYIDRIVIDRSFRGKGIGQQVYDCLKKEPTAEKHGDRHYDSEALPLWLAAEIDIEPANDYSLNFHQRQGFVEVARQSAGEGKRVSLQVLSIA